MTEKLINTAKSQIGYLEKKSNSMLYEKTANAGNKNYTKYWADCYPEYQGQPWCAVFVTWVMEKTFGKEEAKKLLKHYPYVYCPTIAKLFELNANPKVGDIVIFKRNNEFVHTGIVVYTDGDYFETVEGNTSDGTSIIENGGAVCQKSYYNSSLPGTKFVSPDYKSISEDVKMDALNKKISQLEERIRNLENPMIYNYIDDNMPLWARDAVKAAVDKGIVIGTENGKLGLSYSDLRTIVREYRAGMYK